VFELCFMRTDTADSTPEFVTDLLLALWADSTPDPPSLELNPDPLLLLLLSRWSVLPTGDRWCLLFVFVEAAAVSDEPGAEKIPYEETL